MTSPEREEKLTTLKKENSFELRAYQEERKPAKLFMSENGESKYKVRDAGPSPEKEELDYDRIEIIRNQAPKSKLSPRRKWSSLDVLDLSETPEHGQEFSLHYSPLSQRQHTPYKVEPGTVDTEQINFNAARQQFLMLEKSNQTSLPQRPKKSISLSTIFQDWTLTKDWPPKDVRVYRERPDRGLSARSFSVKQAGLEIKRDSFLTSSIDELDSGLEELSGEFGAGYISDDSASSEVFSPTKQPWTPKAETPIEREIRISQEREESLRRERGISRSNLDEMVEIKTKPLLLKDEPLSFSLPRKNKTKSRESLIMQRGTERKTSRVEESCPDDQRPQEEKSSKKGHQALFIQKDNQVSVNTPDHEVTRPNTEAHKSVSFSLEGEAALTKDSFFKAWGQLPNWQTPHGRHSVEISGVSGTSWTGPKSFSRHADLRDDPPPLPSKTEPKSQLALRPESTEVNDFWSKALQMDSTESFNISPRKRHTLEIIAQEIEKDLKREEELRSTRGSNQLPPSAQMGIDTVDHSPTNGTREPGEADHHPPTPPCDTPHPSGLAPIFPPPRTSQGAVSPAAKTSPHPAPATESSKPKGLTHTLLEVFEERRIKMKRDENTYAGIEPSDEVNTEVLESTRVTRHKSSRALMWEAGLFANRAAD
ncbi:mitotic interactor and substrate of PLK1 [Polypterus senegalus]|uniref:mitotic interactor and substrate of PLK1 n=1 Tax=Polypterus senegalus TaxID=55291 RepID=UPI001965C6CA|nr:mitotic interactor and substrate of PLK1 [Polypterus senegalus]